jgi:hypothetical protein
MQRPDGIPVWDFSPAIDLLRALPYSKMNGDSTPLNAREKMSSTSAFLVLSQPQDDPLSLGNFSRIWDFLSSSGHEETPERAPDLPNVVAEPVSKEVRWRDEVSGADLEDNVDTESGVGSASIRTRKRAARRARARGRTDNPGSSLTASCGREVGTTTDSESELESGRPRGLLDRRAVIQDILGTQRDQDLRPSSPPASGSAPKQALRLLRKEWPISNPFQWSSATSCSGKEKREIRALSNEPSEEQKSRLAERLSKSFSSEAKYLKNPGLIYPEFTPLNTSASGIHVFVDISNVSFSRCTTVDVDVSLTVWADHDRFPRLSEAFARCPHLHSYSTRSDVFPQVLTRP